MSTVVRWNASGSRVLHAPTRSRWAEIERGLKFILAGYFALFVLALTGAFLWVASQGSPVLLRLGLADREEVEMSGLVLGLGGAVVGYLLVLLGQDRCLCHAPQDDGAKDGLFVCFVATLLAAPLAVAAPFLDGPWDGDALERILTTVFERKVPAIGSVLQVTAAVLALASVLAFTQFTRVVANRFEGRLLARAGEGFYLYVCILLGSAAGACSTFRLFISQPSLLAALAVACVVGLAWHAALIFGAWRRARRAVRKLLDGLSHDAPAKPYSGVHRVFQVRAE